MTVGHAITIDMDTLKRVYYELHLDYGGHCGGFTPIKYKRYEKRERVVGIRGGKSAASPCDCFQTSCPRSKTRPVPGRWTLRRLSMYEHLYSRFLRCQRRLEGLRSEVHWLQMGWSQPTWRWIGCIFWEIRPRRCGCSLCNILHWREGIHDCIVERPQRR